MNEENKIQKQFRVITFVNREELDFLDTLAKDIYFTHGIHVPRARLVEEIIQAFKEEKGEGIIIEDLIKRIKEKNP
ncbi:MAG: hypothetical protein PHQ96_03780 [Candidatus Omnitrophica bacterium]|nr:hypothetical protein [Candidatus Omnitrophota bacterium]